MTNTRSEVPWAAVLVAAVGYFVDLFDTFLVPALRVPTLRELGVPNAGSFQVYTTVFNWQLAGMALGALFLWGPFADSRGRRKMLFGSILVYGVASLLTALVHDVTQFTIIRFIAGIGLGGELGAGVTLVSENMGREHRGKGTMLIGFVGMLGVVAAAALATTHLSWRTDYVIGGIMAFVVLGLRVGVAESKLFEKMNTAGDRKPNYFHTLAILVAPKNLLKFIACVFVGAPTFFITGLLVPGAPEFGTAFGMQTLPLPTTGLIWTYSSIAIGDILCGGLSQLLRSRKKALLVFHGITVLGIVLFLFFPPSNPEGFYIRCSIAGLGIGFWANMVTNAAEQFGTNVRATVTITVPNLVRLLLFPISAAFVALKPSLGIVHAAAVVGLIASGVAITSVLCLEDGFLRDLDYATLRVPKRLTCRSSLSEAK